MTTFLNPRPVTWLPLQRWAQIIGINPLHFNQLSSQKLFNNNVCGDVWFQDAFQHSDRVGRNDIAMAIQAAEQEIAAEVGYNLIPDWTADERLPYPRPGYATAFNLTGTNVRGMYKSVETPRGHVLSGGVKTKTLLLSGAAIVRTDVDGDGYAEVATVTVPGLASTDENEIRVYNPGQGGEDGFEIRPVWTVISGGSATITFKIWQAVRADLQEQLSADALDGDDVASYETTVDVYRVWNDPSAQVTLMWEGMPYITGGCGECGACQGNEQAGCLHVRDQRMGFVVPSPGIWNPATSLYDYSEWNYCREPDTVRLWYYSGWTHTGLRHPYIQMDPYWEYAVAYYAASKLDRPVCGCSNVNQFIERWRFDVTFVDNNTGSQNVSQEIQGNRFGSSRGAIYAWQRVQQNGKKINK